MVEWLLHDTMPMGHCLVMQRLNNRDSLNEARFNDLASSQFHVEWLWRWARRHLTNYLAIGTRVP